MPGFPIPRTLEEAVHPERMALLVYDMQVGIVRQIADGAAGRGARAADSRGRPGRADAGVLHPPPVAAARADGRIAVPDGHGLAAGGSPGAGEAVVPPRLARLRTGAGARAAPSEAIFDKLAMSAFEGTPLEFALRDCGVIAFAVAGIALEVGIEPTVRHAADLGFLPVVLEDACGAGHAEAAAARSRA
jgi:nicotinamidase-related amidase